MALYLNFILELYYTPWISVIVISHFALGQSATITSHVARAVPFSDKSLTGTPVLTYTAVSKLRCIVECTRTNCSSFNFGLDTCELMLTYVCEDTETLVTRTDFKHYDVEFGIWVQVSNMSLVLRKPAFCICETKDADQLPSNCAADQHLCFRASRIVQSPFFLNPNFSSL